MLTGVTVGGPIGLFAGAFIGSFFILAPAPHVDPPDATQQNAQAHRGGSYQAGGVVIPQSQPEVIKLTAKELFGLTYMVQQSSTASYESMDDLTLLTVHVMMLKTNAQVMVEVKPNSTVKELRQEAALKLRLPPAQLMLIFDNNQLDDHQEMKYEGIGSGSMVIAMKCSPGQKMGVFELDASSLAPEFDHDFTKKKDDGKTYQRGDFTYTRPYGWKRYAVKVIGEYEDDTWLGVNGIRQETTSGEWPVSYHGTGKCQVKGIIEQGYKIGHRARFGKGIYTSPALEKVCEFKYAQEFTHEGKQYRVAMQNRVNPENLQVYEPDKTGHKDFPYWVSPGQDSNSGIFDVRPYGILTKEA